MVYFGYPVYALWFTLAILFMPYGLLWLSCLCPMVYCYQTHLNYFVFQYFDIERTL
jgi:hypothetical protein